jgi:hypothetical protein
MFGIVVYFVFVVVALQRRVRRWARLLAALSNNMARSQRWLLCRPCGCKLEMCQCLQIRCAGYRRKAGACSSLWFQLALHGTMGYFGKFIGLTKTIARACVECRHLASKTIAKHAQKDGQKHHHMCAWYGMWSCKPCGR